MEQSLEEVIYLNRGSVMVKIIETNISYKDNEIADHQSRVIEVDEWDFYTRIFDEYNPNLYPIQFESIIGNVWGGCVPKHAKITHLEYDDYHLKCDMRLYNGFRQTKLAYRVEG